MAAIGATRWRRVFRGGRVLAILCGLFLGVGWSNSVRAGHWHGHGCGVGWGACRPVFAAPRGIGWCGPTRTFVGGWGGGSFCRPPLVGWGGCHWRPWSYYGYCAPGWGYAFRGWGGWNAWGGCGFYGGAPWYRPVGPVWFGAGPRRPFVAVPAFGARPMLGAAALRVVSDAPLRPAIERGEFAATSEVAPDWDAPGLDLDEDLAAPKPIEPVVIAGGAARWLGDSPETHRRELIYPLVRESSQSARRRAAEYVEFGDRLFRERRYASARVQYQLAATAASDWGLPYLRSAIAASAVGEYADAAALARRAASVDPRVGRREFQLADLYAPESTDVDSHRERLAQAALDDPENSDLVFLLGVLLHVDGQTDRAGKFFAHAVRLGLPEDSHVLLAFASGPAAELAARDERL